MWLSAVTNFIDHAIWRVDAIREQNNVWIHDCVLQFFPLTSKVVVQRCTWEVILMVIEIAQLSLVKEEELNVSLL